MKENQIEKAFSQIQMFHKPSPFQNAIAFAKEVNDSSEEQNVFNILERCVGFKDQGHIEQIKLISEMLIVLQDFQVSVEEDEDFHNFSDEIGTMMIKMISYTSQIIISAQFISRYNFQSLVLPIC